MTERELFNLMWQASWQATEAAIAAGHRRDSKVTKDSAWRAAQAVYAQHRPAEAPVPQPVSDPIFERMNPA